MSDQASQDSKPSEANITPIEDEEANQTQISQPESIEQSSDSQPMEVHYEPHFKHGHHKKHLAEYAKEFLMIFFAVFLGFLAENLREHIAEKGKERDYVRGFISNLKDDQGFLSFSLKYGSKQQATMDTMAKLVNSPMTVANSKQLYILTSNYALEVMPFYTNDATMQQVISSDGLKLLNKNHAADSLVAYYSGKSWLQEENNDIKFVFRELIQLEDKIFAYDVLYNPNIKLLTSAQFRIMNKSTLPSFANKLLNVKHQIHKFNDFELESRMRINKQLINFLKKTYDWKEE